MRETRILYFALGVLVVASVGAVSLHDTGVGFPDGSFQTTAPVLTASTAVQGQVSLVSAGGFSYCSSLATVFSVPAGKRLVIEWLAVESAIFGGAVDSHPVEVDIVTHNGVGETFYPLTRLEDPIVIGDAFHLGARWVAPVRLYSEAGHAVKARMCFETSFEFADPVGTVGFSGYLVDV